VDFSGKKCKENFHLEKKPSSSLLFDKSKKFSNNKGYDTKMHRNKIGYRLKYNPIRF